jgi:hypothetical protein
MNSLCRWAAGSRSMRSGGALALFLGCVLYASVASATQIAFSGTSQADGHPVSGTADFTLGAGTATIVLTNTTTTTHDAGELFTGIKFSLGGLSLGLSSKTGIERTVAGNGSFTDTGSAQNLTWSLTAKGSGVFQLDFSPDATDAIIGPPSGGDYSGANNSIDGNGGHNPFVGEKATFVVTNASINANTSINVTSFLFDTVPDPANGTITVGNPPPSPEPSTLVLMVLGAAIAAFGRRR